MNTNRIALSGRIAASPTRRVTTTGKTVVKSRLAHNQWAPKDAPQKPAIFIDIEVWDNKGDMTGPDALMSVDKGAEVVAEGWLKLDSWTGDDGAKRERFVISLTNLDIVSGRKTGAEPAPYGEPVRDDDIPF